MSRLDSFIRRMTAQRDCLDAAARHIGPGPVLEIGLGNGRSYDHLRCLLPDRDIYVFDRRVAAHPDCIPDDDHLFRGELAVQLPLAVARLAGTVALVHNDTGSGRPERDRPLATLLGATLPRLLQPGGLVVSDQPLETSLTAHALPASVAAGRYFMYRAP